MTFDPFGDFKERGYLRNVERIKDPAVVKRVEAVSFRASIDDVLAHLKSKSEIGYQDVLDTHKKLFSSVYPWAGQSRTENAPGIAISKAGRDDLFAHPRDIQRAVEYALTQAADPKRVRERPGEIFGQLAHAHPFLEGNGRTILAVHSEITRRAGVSIDWARTNKQDYLRALTAELEQPGKGKLDEYLKPFVERKAATLEKTAEVLKEITAPSAALANTAKLLKAQQARVQAQKNEQGPER
ncbi:filamentation induced by cAMP protein Fic [Tepidicaulis marinus]|uniref:protein adenylyltransferase n=1 Tax=Tepidicaulis marinus TaxID=1333998 RepID=A0A081BF26_9HYPH|nr:Fic family protein [Tepidicaulis marinus]GAK46644.1 filamentation induced by cAMP protein Fic [Tepidicaulis marinus]